jgi:hypothetical protein
MLRPGIVIITLWVGWAISWIAASRWSNLTENRPSIGPEIGYRILMGIGTVLMFVPAHGYEGRLRLWHVGWVGAWACGSVGQAAVRAGHYQLI